jgi:hypothetical protein
VANAIRELGHGGTLLLISPGCEESLPVKIKYRTGEVQLLDECFVRFMNLRHRIGDRDFDRESGEETVQDPHPHLTPAFIEAERDLADAERFVAQLSAVDGALILSSSLSVVGFGAEILMDRAAPTKVFEVDGSPYVTREWPELDSESFGMRHRSAVRFVGGTMNTVAFIVSQDGHVSFCWKRSERVFLKRNVSLSNPNMAGA